MFRELHEKLDDLCMDIVGESHGTLLWNGAIVKGVFDVSQDDVFDGQGNSFDGGSPTVYLQFSEVGTCDKGDIIVFQGIQYKVIQPSDYRSDGLSAPTIRRV